MIITLKIGFASGYIIVFQRKQNLNQAYIVKAKSRQ